VTALYIVGVPHDFDGNILVVAFIKCLEDNSKHTFSNFLNDLIPFIKDGPITDFIKFQVIELKLLSLQLFFFLI